MTGPNDLSAYPILRRRMATVERRPARTGAVRTALRRGIRQAIAPLLGPVQRARQTQLAELLTPADRIVFLGDSITEGGMWDEWLPDHRVINRGVSGETTAQIAARLDGAVNAPRAIALLAGTNDIGSGVSTSAIIAGFRQIVDGIETRAPGTPVIVQSIMPRAIAFREEIIHVNRLIRNEVDRHRGRLRYLDLWPALADRDGALRSEFTEDNLHLNGAGYRAWVDVLRPVIDQVVR